MRDAGGTLHDSEFIRTLDRPITPHLESRNSHLNVRCLTLLPGSRQLRASNRRPFVHIATQQHQVGFLFLTDAQKHSPG
jgi:hypothetical protein